MTQTEPEPKAQGTVDLLRSLQRSILRLRHEAEDLQLRLADSGEAALSATLPRIAKLEGLIRDCQKVEKTLAEQNDQGTHDPYAIDLAAARIEISRRLDRLRASLAADNPDAGDD
ncbi:recombinase [Pseudophaeobacter flagellatus]|uniref:recombinase n=1 Tax=Pseudophaeobacter flagellatus TaxID=2899119 RepID=UPI001E42662D|nr:recombinase [Pseudophaeobacter flagellatus]MCD9147682.1 recombinase [Pseudophaeobacter flagellatus]